MALLLATSIWCWLLIVEGAFAVFRLDRSLRPNLLLLSEGPFSRIRERGAESSFIRIATETVGETRARITEAMQREARIILTRAEGGLPNLAVISSVAPFVGLFGTVWGIMTSFIGIAAAQDTSLAVVAPGIAEALAATAYGLAAAIPATIGYNRIGASLGRVGQILQHAIEEEAVKLTAATKGEA